MTEEDEDWEETLWTPAARELYSKRAEDLIAEIRRHVASVVQREGRAAEEPGYFDSAERVQATVAAFNEPESDWCGSSSLRLHTEAWKDEDWDEDDEVEEVDTQGNVLTVVGRWTFRITDPEAVIAAGRAAYLSAWPDDTAEDAQHRVQDVAAAVREVEHAHGFASIEATPGLELAGLIPVELGFGVYEDDEDVETVAVALDENERTLLAHGLKDWDGPALGTNSLALAMGFTDALHLMEEAERIAQAITAGQALTVRDWTRALACAEFAFASKALGAGPKWTTIHGGTDPHWISVLRALQHKVPTAQRFLGP